MVIVSISGGLGNQMFQYAAGKALAQRYDAELLLDISSYENNALREYELGSFRLNARTVSRDEIGRIVSPKLRLFLKAAQKIGLFANCIPLFSEPHFHYSPKFKEISPPVFLVGYWQCERYFKPIEQQLRNDFSFEGAGTPGNLAMLESITSTPNSVSIHIRRGDYLSNPDANATHGLCAPQYYERAIEYIATQVTAPHFFVFSDDLDWVANNFCPQKYPWTLVDTNNVSTSYLDLMLMSTCQHHIIANSSFSWWGAWLQEKQNSLVCAPKQWFCNNVHNTADIIPRRWTRL